MKTVLKIILGLFLTANLVTAQDTLYVYKAGAVVSQRAIVDIDSVAFFKMYLPTITTSPASSITTNAATCGGTVTADGGSSVTARGVCWSTTSSPTVINSKTINSTGDGSFTSSITGLSEFTTYYVRAYATNSMGTSYGSQVSFTTTGSFPINGLVAWYPFNGNANDESGNANNGTVNGSTLAADRFGNASKAYSFDGVNDYVTCTAIPAVNGTSGLAISVWVKITGQNNANCSLGCAQYFVSRGSDYQSGFFGIGCWEGTQNNFMGVINRAVNGPGLAQAATSINIPQSNWHHVVLNYDKINVKIYVDGVLAGTKAYIVYVETNTSPIIIGKQNVTGFEYFTSGLIDDVGIWNRALTQQEITNLYNLR